MIKRLSALGMTAMLCLGCAAKNRDEPGRMTGIGVGAAGTGLLGAAGNPCAGMAVLMRGLLEVTGVNDALRSLGGDEPDPRFVAFMAEQQSLAEGRMAARRLEREASLSGVVQNSQASTDSR